MTNMKTSLAIVFGIAAALATVLGTALTTVAFAKITQETTNTSCTNNADHLPGGQQTTCQNTSGLNQQTSTTCSHNPSSTTSCPPGQNK